MCYARRQRSSWARIKLSKNLYHISSFHLSYNLFYFELFYLSFFYFCWVYITLRRDLHLLFLLCTYLLLFNFQWPFVAFSRGDFVIIPQCFRIVNTFLKSFLKNFSCAFGLTEKLWWASRDSNPGPTGYEPVALTNWATGPNLFYVYIIY